MREVPCRLQDLPNMHPRLPWETIGLATAAVLAGVGGQPPYPFVVHTENIPGFGGAELMLAIDPGRSAMIPYSDYDGPLTSPGRWNWRPSALPGWLLLIQGDMRSAMWLCGEAPLTTWWATIGLASKLPVARAGRISNPPGNISGTGFLKSTINHVTCSLPSSKPSRPTRLCLNPPSLKVDGVGPSTVSPWSTYDHVRGFRLGQRHAHDGQVPRGPARMLAEMVGDRHSAARHFLAAAHMELVLAADFEGCGDTELAVRSRLSAASCFWRARDTQAALGLIQDMLRPIRIEPRRSVNFKRTSSETSPRKRRALGRSRPRGHALIGGATDFNSRDSTARAGIQ